MKKFVKHLLLFSVMVVLFFIIGEIYVEKTAYKHDEIAWRAMRLEQEKDSIRTLFIGSSLLHAAVSDTLWGPEAFNMSVVAASTEYLYYFADTVIPRLPNLERVVLELSYHTLRDTRDFSKNNVSFVGWCRPTVYWHTRKYSRWSTHGFELFDAATFRNKLFNNHHGSGKDDVDDLLAAPENLWDAQERLNQGKNLSINQTKDTTYYHDNLRLVEGIIQKAQKHGAEVTLCIPPVLEEFRQQMDPGQLAELYSTVDMLCRKYRLRCFDYLADDRFGVADFIDINHLNHGPGRTKFTVIFRHDLLAAPSQPQGDI